MSRKVKRNAYQQAYPFFINKDSTMLDPKFEIEPSWDYGTACNAGTAGAYDLIRSYCDYKPAGGMLQDIALKLVSENEELTDSKRGFIVGFFCQIEQMLMNAYANDSVKQIIESKQYNNHELSPLSFRGVDAKGGAL